MTNKVRTAAETFVVTGPTSGIGLSAALTLAGRGTIVLVGRNGSKVEAVRRRIVARGHRAVSVICDLGDLASVQRAAAEIIGLGLSITALLNNAGIMAPPKSTTANGWDLTFATNHLGPFALTEALIPYLPDGAGILFVASAIEDPERRPAKLMGMRGGRFISVEASVRGEWLAGGAKLPGIDAYATAKQCVLATAFALAREHPHLRINAVEPGINPSTGLGGTNAAARFIFGQIVTRLPPFARYRSTPERAAAVIETILVDRSGATGTYFDETGAPMTGSAASRDPTFQERVVAETRALLGADADRAS